MTVKRYLTPNEAEAMVALALEQAARSEIERGDM